MLPQTERNPQQAAQRDVQKQPEEKAGTDILVTLLIDHIGHVLREYRIERSRRQQGKDKDIKHRTGEELPLHKSQLVKSQKMAH